MVRVAKPVVWLTACVVLLAACQQSLGVGAVNNCNQLIEATATDTSEGDQVWFPVEVGEDREIRGLVVDPIFIYLYTRVPDDVEWERFVIPREHWNQWRTEGDYDILIPLEGEFCP